MGSSTFQELISRKNLIKINIYTKCISLNNGWWYAIVNIWYSIINIWRWYAINNANYLLIIITNDNINGIYLTNNNSNVNSTNDVNNKSYGYANITFNATITYDANNITNDDNNTCLSTTTTNDVNHSCLSTTTTSLSITYGSTTTNDDNLSTTNGSITYGYATNSYSDANNANGIWWWLLTITNDLWTKSWWRT